jgi:drug/metabolite transporter (DMT)-like permease
MPVRSVRNTDLADRIEANGVQRAARPAAPEPSLVLGAALMVVGVTCFTSLDTILKLLVQRHDPLFLVWGRNFVQVVYLAAAMPLLVPGRMLRMRRPLVHVGRGLGLVLSTLFIILSLRHMPMAQTYAITFSMPLMATILAALLLGERVSLPRLACIVLGFAGVLVALRPGAPDAGAYLVYPLAMAVANAGFHVLTRYGGRDEDPLALLFTVGLFAFLIVSLALPWIFEPMSASDWGLLALGAAFGTLGQFLVIEAYRRAPTAIVSPMLYAQIIAAGLLGYLVFGEVPGPATLIGAAIVTASGIVLVRTKA